MAQPSVILATASYDHTIRFWEAKSGRCYRTIQYPDSVSNGYWYLAIHRQHRGYPVYKQSYVPFSALTCLQQVNRLEITPDKRFLAAAGNPHIRLFDVNSNSPQPVRINVFNINPYGSSCSFSLFNESTPSR